MKIVFVSKYFNHHQKPFCDSISALSNVDYRFIATKKSNTTAVKLGWASADLLPSYVIKAYEDEATRKTAIKLINEADVVIAGSAPEDMVFDRIRDNKIVFRYSERPLKNGLELEKYLPRFIKWRHYNPNSKRLYLLCASAYVSNDYRKFGMFLDRGYKWGYFPKTNYYEDFKSDILQKKDKTSILWAGRLIDWKHPDDAVNVAKKLKSEGVEFKMNIVGEGDMRDKLSSMITDYGLDDCVKLLGAVRTDELRKYMESSGIFLFTSDFEEGWGAVLNEAMNSGCAVVANHAAGSTPYLVKHNENGMIYKNGDTKSLFEITKLLLSDKNKQTELSLNAYHTIVDLWNSDVAAKRFVEISKSIISSGKSELYDDGPCSNAGYLKNNWFS